jgi:hypothetical protein
MENENEKKPEEKEEYLPKLPEMVDRLEKANKEAREILARNEELAARNLLGGKTDAGIQPPTPKEETSQEYAARISKGQV